MSYATMDHAGWVERNIAASKSTACRAKRRKPGPVSRRGLKNGPDKLSPFQARAMDILGMVFGGIYNAPINWGTVDWDYGGGVSVTTRYRRSMATWDFQELTRFVFLCHEARVRGEIQVAGFGLRLSMWQRSDAGTVGSRHPNLAEAVAAFREYLPVSHPIIWREEPAAERAA